MILRRCVTAYLRQSGRIWYHLPASVRLHAAGQAYGRHLHALVRRFADRTQNHSTFFLRNRPELELLRRLLDRKPHGSTLNMTVLACSKGAEVYSFLWAIRSVRPDLRVRTYAIDISQEILDFAETGVYSRDSADPVQRPNHEAAAGKGDATWRDQSVSIFSRMTAAEMDAMFEVEDDQVRVRANLKEGITWLCGDAFDPELVKRLGTQDVVVANRFLCHMKPAAAEKCLRNIVRLVKPGGYLFVSGLDLDVRTKVARGMGWKPVSEMTKEVYEGDVSLAEGWPFEYWGLEPFREGLPDRGIRFASVFQIGEARVAVHA